MGKIANPLNWTEEERQKNTEDAYGLGELKKRLEPKLELLGSSPLADDIGELLEQFQLAVGMEDELHDTVFHLQREIFKACVALKAAGVHLDSQVQPIWTRLLAVAEWCPEEPPEDWQPTSEDLDSLERWYGKRE